ncbi:DNA damage-regulated autophagy modulator protein 1-like [Clytia hemisphaerica]|uniref:CWH43-like N-terminal domain-containing protein n=1 Tax=Clytia hemisphaerica TaxID=252671 RepID=A0A7M5WZH1_9CNID|eukprot:TCONS_00000433-protein
MPELQHQQSLEAVTVTTPITNQTSPPQPITTNNQHSEHGIQFCWFIFSLPLVSSFLSFIACLIAYRVGVDEKRLQPLPFIPFISDIGDVKPGSSFFTFFLILSSLVTLIIITVRYYQVASKAETDKSRNSSPTELRSNRDNPLEEARTKRSIQRLNTAALVSSCIFLVCKIGVSSFQLNNYKKIHLGFACFYFFGAALYTVFQVCITFKMIGGLNGLKKLLTGDMSSKCQGSVFLSRVICSLALIINFFIVGVFVTVPSLKVHNRGGANVGQSAEWAFAGFKLFFFSTFSYEFWKIRFTFLMKFDEIEKTKTESFPIKNCDTTDGLPSQVSYSKLQ